MYENKNALPRAYVLYGEKGPESRWTRVEITDYSPGKIEISARLKEKGRLFLSDSFYPGWKAYVDGKEAGIERESGYYRSVKLIPGEHKVRFVYDPLSFKLGALISVLSFLGLAIGGIVNFKKNR